ncbi:hypothetical protein F5884DRAFT_745846 [Xylogone sp. PMI_703]|nr:hypothetical protein F5884DRAFT_745846 [Xylogone sp. PMI_703]
MASLLASVSTLRRRDGSSSSDGISPSMLNLLIALLVLIFVSLLLLGALYFLRRARMRRRNEELPLYNENPSSNPAPQDVKNPHGLTISTPPYYSYSDEKPPLSPTQKSPSSPVPEIRITFPDETDETGRPKSGRVVVVRISETGGVGLEPLQHDEEQLPAYEKEAKDGQKFQSIDMNSIGGLKEKSEWN